MFRSDRLYWIQKQTHISFKSGVLQLQSEIEQHIHVDIKYY